MARTAYSGRKINKPIAEKKREPVSQKSEKKDEETQEEEAKPTPINIHNISRKKSMSVKTPRIVVPEETENVTHKIRKKSMVHKEIKFFQRSTDMLVNKLPFVRFVRETVSRLSQDSRTYRFTRTSLLALQEAFEAYVVSLLEDSNLCANHASRVTLFPKDIDLVKKLSKKAMN